jgi:urease accessory protein
MTTPHTNSPAGSGQLTVSLSSQSSTSHFTSLRATYPLKLISPARLPAQPCTLSTAYILAYGGGLVAGDEVSLKVDVEEGAGILLLTQGSTKVFKIRPGIRPRSLGQPSHSHSISNPSQTSPTRQRLWSTQSPNTLLLLLPDPISPFAASSYIQSQRFDLPSSSSLLVLDWYTSGRRAGKGEEWVFNRYESSNWVKVDGRTLMKERVVLEDEKGGSSVGERMEPYHVFATVMIYGDDMKKLLEEMSKLALDTVQRQSSNPAEMIWSFSYIKIPTPPLSADAINGGRTKGPKQDAGKAGVIKAAAKDVEMLRNWLRERLEEGGVKGMIGSGLWDRVF